MDSKGRLLVGAATHTREGSKEHVAQLVTAGVDVIIIVSVVRWAFLSAMSLHSNLSRVSRQLAGMRRRLQE